MFGLEPWHIVLLLAVVLVFFGPKRLPEIGKSVGETIREFRKATTDVANSVTTAPAPPPVPPATTTTPPPPATPSPVPSDRAPVHNSIESPAPAPVEAPSATQVEPQTPQADAADPNPPAGTAG